MWPSAEARRSQHQIQMLHWMSNITYITNRFVWWNLRFPSGPHRRHYRCTIRFVSDNFNVVEVLFRFHRFLFFSHSIRSKGCVYCYYFRCIQPLESVSGLESMWDSASSMEIGAVCSDCSQWGGHRQDFCYLQDVRLLCLMCGQICDPRQKWEPHENHALEFMILRFEISFWKNTLSLHIRPWRTNNLVTCAHVTLKCCKKDDFSPFVTSCPTCIPFSHLFGCVCVTWIRGLCGFGINFLQGAAGLIKRLPWTHAEQTCPGRMRLSTQASEQRSHVIQLNIAIRTQERLRKTNEQAVFLTCP